MANEDELIVQFIALTGITATEARPFLETNHWDLEAAATEYFTSMEEGEREPQDGYEEEMAATEPPRHLPSGDASVPPIPASESGPSTSRAAPKKKFATLGDLQSSRGQESAGDSPDPDTDPDQDLFAGGEKSGLAVQNPDDIKRKILEQAKRHAPRPDQEQTPPPKSHFTGTARTLGGDDVESRIIPDSRANELPRPTRVSRILHFWQDGFSIDDGPLHRSDDPRNQSILQGIRQGRAPLSIMNVEPGQEVDVNIEQHEGNYVQPKKKYRPFSGQGQRLGSPTPGLTMSTPAPAAAPTQPAQGSPPTVDVDSSQPSVTLQIRLGDGTRLTSRFNTSHTIGDVYDFVTRANPQSLARSWVLMTTFPSKELSDKNAVLGDLSDFKRGGVVVQKWT